MVGLALVHCRHRPAGAAPAPRTVEHVSKRRYPSATTHGEAQEGSVDYRCADCPWLHLDSDKRFTAAGEIDETRLQGTHGAHRARMGSGSLRRQAGEPGK